MANATAELGVMAIRIKGNMIRNSIGLLLFSICLYDLFVGIHISPLIALLVWVSLSLVFLASSPKQSSNFTTVLVFPLCLYAAFVSNGLAGFLIPIYELVPAGSYLALVNIVLTSMLIALATAIATSPLLATLAKNHLALAAFVCALINYLYEVSSGFSDNGFTNVVIALEQLFVFFALWFLAMLLNKSAITSALSARMAKATA